MLSIVWDIYNPNSWFNKLDRIRQYSNYKFKIIADHPSITEFYPFLNLETNNSFKFKTDVTIHGVRITDEFTINPNTSMTYSVTSNKESHSYVKELMLVYFPQYEIYDIVGQSKKYYINRSSSEQITDLGIRK